MKRIFYCLATLLVLATNSEINACGVTLKWTAPGDDGMVGKVTKYDIRYSVEKLTSDNWNSARSVEIIEDLVSGGEMQIAKIDGLETGQTYYFALKGCDDAENWSIMSNVVEKVAGFSECTGVRGNVNCDIDEIVNIEDIMTLIDFLFLDGVLGCCLGEANLFDEGHNQINIMDLTVLIQYYYHNDYFLTDCKH